MPRIFHPVRPWYRSFCIHLGAFFFVLGALFLLLEFLIFLTGRGLTRPLGAIWFQFDASSLNFVQAVIQRYAHPSLWTGLFTPLLSMKAWKSLTGLFLFFWILGSFLRQAGAGRKKRFF